MIIFNKWYWDNWISALQEKLKPDSIQLVQNNGKLQEVKHYHLHLIPRFSEDKEGKENLEEVLKAIME